MADNSSIPVASGNETFANKDIAGVKFPKHIPYDSSGAEIVPPTATQIGGVTETAPASDTASSGLNGRLQRIAQRITAMITLWGAATDAKSTATDTTSVSLMQVFKQISASVQALVTAIGSTAWDLGVGATGSRTQRVVIANESQMAPGRAAAASSTPVVISTEDLAAIGSLTETAPASDTASSGLNGRLQRIAQRLTSIIALFGPQTTGGLNTYYNADLDEAAVAVKASAGGLFNIVATNRTTAPLFLHFWDVAQGSVTVGTTPVKFTLEIPANASDHTMAMPNFNPHGVAFGTAITAAVTTALAGTGAPAANACVITIAHK